MIQSETLQFLSELKENNHKEWFDENRDTYQKARQNFIQVIDRLIEGITEFDHTLDGLEPKHSLFRINRDIRFSKNKNPYKTNMGAYLARGGRKSIYAGYYFHLEPGNIFIGGGCYQPMAPELAKIRTHIDLEAAKLKKVTSGTTFSQLFEEIRGEELKSAPKGYPKDHPDIDLLRKKSFFVMTHLSDQDVQKENFVEKALDIYEKIYPFNQFFNEALEE
ncbi:MAG: DUF2461 domain-containing protein [Bacteroidetes bacterium]|nr:DUF2461 domain-containing protein [Bacteroidota bacterium]